MAINPETQVNASVVLDKKVYEVLKKLSKDNKRSVSSQIAYIIEKYLNEQK